MATPIKISGRSSSVQNSNPSSKSASIIPADALSINKSNVKPVSKSGIKQDQLNSRYSHRLEQTMDEDERLVRRGFGEIINSN